MRMSPFLPARAPSSASWRFMALALCAALAACETAPRAGSETQAQVLDVVTDRHALRDGHPELYAALRAGVARRELDEGRLVEGECGVPDGAQPSGMRWHTVTVLLPPGVRLPRRTVADVHELRGPVPAWAFDFAAAGLRRLDALRDSDLAAGRVLRLGCQLKVLDGGDWYAPVWVATAPDRLRLAPGDVVRLRVGAEAGSKDAGPPAEVLERRTDVAAPGGKALVRCG
ncbi:MAG: hypothetical protein GTN84_16685 [Hydrogenophaga sp.]|nr:hypothetical protein [Hydrogenophaga sp.]NIM42217.1 hypothetical protein [Hydrogenophaga sp.]NIN54616.1 hypothetical protein [Hydrogenophaga sp.]NIO51292.1 hypothetical protein [Hydrogenophaga sp.]NIO90846.1 hypothetical protein [Hydrogenophaga sp.]NIQ47912.1 hypothetical protein [Hydrogenophaga sp.]